MKRRFGPGDAALATFVFATAAMLLVPLPTILLDLLITLNLAFSVLLLLVGLYVPTALGLLSFPTLLLLTTLFRLGLNVASCRLILSDGDAGRVIEAFGTFLVRGEVVVGLLIFAIVTIVNFVVIAKGASRVSEVAARFALDALPGKQAEIDSDLRAGVLSPAEARGRRDDLRKESQLYGSMDGAMKFVQGDAVAGFFIIVVNVVGGIYLGLSRGDSVEEAVATYTTLTVGDGLVSQIPALLISICAGVVVTRVSSGEVSTLGSDVGNQLFGRPGVLATAGAIVLLAGLLPGLPLVPFALVASLFGAAAFARHASSRRGVFGPAGQELRLDPRPGAGSLPAPDAEESVPDDSPLVVRLDAAVLYRVHRLNVQSYRAWWRDFRSDFYDETGVRLPDLSVVPDESLPPSGWAVYHDATRIDSGRAVPGGILVETCPQAAVLFGLDVAAEETHPVTGNRVFWTVQSPFARKVLNSARFRTYDFMEFICLRIGAYFNRYPEEVLTLTDVHFLMKGLDKKYPGLVAEALDKSLVDVSRVTDLMQELVREGVSVKDFKQLVESVAAYQSLYRSLLSEPDDFDLHHLVSFVRVQRRRQILSRLLSEDHTLKVVTLSEEVEQQFESLPVDPREPRLAADPQTLDSLAASLRRVTAPMTRNGLLPVCVLCRGELRPKVAAFLRGTEMRERAVAFEELDPAYGLRQVGVWGA